MFFRKLLIIIILITTRLHAQQIADKGFVQYTTAQGLTHNTITGITQDSAGYLWISTHSGVNRFNGSQFVQFHSSSDTTAIPSEEIKGMAWIGKNKLALYTSGLHIINTATGKSTNIFVPYHQKQYQYKFNMVERVMGDEEENIFVLTRSGFYHYDKSHKLIYRFDYYREIDVPFAHFFFGREFVQIDLNRFLIASIDGLYIYDKRERVLRKLKPEDSSLLAGFLDYKKHFYLFYQQKPGKLIVFKSGSDSVFYVDVTRNMKTVSRLPFPASKTEIHYWSKLFSFNDSALYLTGHVSGFYKMKLDPVAGKLQMDPHKYMAGQQCNSVHETKCHNLWIGTNKGLFQMDDNRLTVQTLPMPLSLETEHANIFFSRVHIDKDHVFAGTRSVGHVVIYDKRTGAVKKILDFDEFRKQNGKPMSVYSATDFDQSTILLGTNGPLIKIDREKLVATKIISPLWHEGADWSGEVFRDHSGTIWISSGKVIEMAPGRTATYIPTDVQATSNIQQPEVIREDAQGNIWMAGHGISRYNRTTRKFDVRLDSFPYVRMPDKQVSAMVIDRGRNVIWFNSNNNGLISYDIWNGKFRHFTTSDGLPDNTITALFLHNNYLWIAGMNSIAALNLYSNKITVFGKEDGFPDIPIANRSNFFFDSSSREIFIAYSHAIARFSPERLMRKKTPPSIFIEELTINDKKTIFLPASTIRTSWNENELRMTIGSINFNDASTQRYAYRIKRDGSTPWILLDRQPTFSISNLSSRDHLIEVKVYSANNRWPEQIKQFTLSVTPPFWLRSWFLALVALIAAVLIYLLVQWRTTAVRKKEMEKTQIEKLKADDYRAQFELEQISNYFSSSLAGIKDADEVLWDVARNLIGRMNYEDCIIYMWNKDKTRMVQKAAYGPKGIPEVILKSNFQVEPGQGIVGHVIKTKEPLLVNDTRKDNRYRVDDDFRLSEVAVPIIHNNELLGVIDSENSQPGFYNERDIKILTTIATLIGNKITQIKSEQKLEAKQKELAGINEQLAEARLSALQSQMNPHFVFNALNSIKRMILDSDNEKASRYLSKFALMIRMTLEHSKQIFVPLEENIKYLQAYLEMEKLRFDDTFCYNISIDENIDSSETYLPSMMIQPIVENAIWHGLMTAENEKNICIRFDLNDEMLMCIVEDNGIGINQSEKQRELHRPLHRSVGLDNLRKRIRIMNDKYDTECSLIITDLSQEGNGRTGTRVTLQLKLINADKQINHESNFGG